MTNPLRKSCTDCRHRAYKANEERSLRQMELSRFQTTPVRFCTNFAGVFIFARHGSDTHSVPEIHLNTAACGDLGALFLPEPQNLLRGGCQAPKERLGAVRGNALCGRPSGKARPKTEVMRPSKVTRRCHSVAGRVGGLGRRLPGLAVPIGNAALREVVRRHFKLHAVAGQNTDIVLAHLA